MHLTTGCIFVFSVLGTVFSISILTYADLREKSKTVPVLCFFCANIQLCPHLLPRNILLQDTHALPGCIAPQNRAQRRNALLPLPIISAHAYIPDMGTQLFDNLLHIPHLLR